MKTNIYLVFLKYVKAIAFSIVLLISSFTVFGQDSTSGLTLEKDYCASNDTVCASTYQNGSWGAYVSWQEPSFTLGGANVSSFTMLFNFSEVKFECWVFNYVQRTGDNNLQLFQSNGIKDTYPFVVTPLVYLDPPNAEGGIGSEVNLTVINPTSTDIPINLYTISADYNDTISVDTNFSYGNTTDMITLIVPTTKVADDYYLMIEFEGTKQILSNLTVDNLEFDGYVANSGTCSDEIDFSIAKPDYTSGSFFTPGEYTIDYIATYTEPDGVTQQKDTCSFTIKVLEPPMIDCPSPVASYSFNANTDTCSYVADESPFSVNWLYDSEGSIVCDDGDVEIRYFIGSSEITFPFSFAKGETTVTAVSYLTDSEDLSLSYPTSSCDFTVIVAENSSPAISGCPDDITVNSEDVDPLTCSQTVTWTEPTAEDNCDGSLSIFSQTHYPGDTFDKGTTSVVYVFQDSDGNQSTCSFDVTVVDNTTPVLTMPSDVTIACTDDNTPASTGSATAVDACSIATVAFSDATAAGNCAGNYVITRTWTATDDCGNAASLDQII
ncbi:HYR domain-containing protein, partial [Mangrovibacterium lignilyticum]|uniref:HYR domain-containing protein n=1 Tax=Mangrovibacterium lignilyticum TaxID=2668052 RepID=UPI0013D2B2CC